MRYFCRIAYDGTNYCGWQKQPRYRNSIEEQVEVILSKLLDEDIIVYAAGRTDKGVHALNQCFHFDTRKQIKDLNKFIYAFNRLIAADIRLNSIEEVSDDFFARFACKQKQYLYKINTGIRNPFTINYEYQLLRKLDVESMREASQIFVGKLNFMNFTSKEEDEKNFVRTITSIDIDSSNDIVSILFCGDGFMRYMVRMISGTLIQVGLHKLDLDDVKSLLFNKKRHVVKYKAPAQGLYLLDILY